MESQALKEVEDLHRFIAEWMTGGLADTDRVFARFAGAMSGEFTLIGPSANITGRAALIAEFRAAHGVHRGAGKDLRIWIENARARRLGGGLALVAYEEWQRISGAVTARQSSAIFGADETAVNGVAWLHLHETWLRPPADFL